MIISTVKQALENYASIEDFVSEIRLQGFDIYLRNGMPQGIIGKRKYRFASLGFSIGDLTRESERMRGIEISSRGKSITDKGR